MRSKTRCAARIASGRASSVPASTAASPATGAQRTSTASRAALPQMPQLELAKKLRSAAPRSNGARLRTVTTLYRWTSGSSQ